MIVINWDSSCPREEVLYCYSTEQGYQSGSFWHWFDRSNPRQVSVRELLTALVVGKKPNDFVFTRDGSPLGNFRKTWANVCVAAGVGALHCPSCDEVVTVDSDGPSTYCGGSWGRSDLKYRGLIFHDRDAVLCAA